MLRAPRSAVLAVLGAVVCGSLAACGSSAPTVAALSRAEVDAALASTPPSPLPATAVKLERSAGELLPEPDDEAEPRLNKLVASLRGTPVVVNVWGEWCGPCKKEMPIFQREAIAQRGKVVFLGVATYGKRSDAEGYLRTKIAMPYASLRDEPGDVTNGTGIGGVPKTLFFDRSGKRVVHQGVYETQADLEADIGRYAAAG